MPEKIRAIHYLNQFFAGIGGEEHAGIRPEWRAGTVGPGHLLTQLVEDIEIVGTVVAGDNFMAEHPEQGVAAVLELIAEHADSKGPAGVDVLLAGPAFNAGRYGMACGAVCKAVQERFEIPSLTALYRENPAVDNYRRDVTIVEASDNVLGMRDALLALARVGAKLVRAEPIVPADDGTIPRGLRQNFFAARDGATRAIEMLLAKLAGDSFATEYVVPVFDRVPPAPPVVNMSKATVAVVTSGGIVPAGNPDRIESASASRYGAYSLEGIDSLTPATHQSVHGGYDPTYANADPNRVLPIDALRQLEKEGRIGRLYSTYFATVGNATPVKRAVRFGQEIAARLVNEGVQAVVFTST